MRTLYGIKIPEGARAVEVRSSIPGSGRARVLYRGPVEENGVWLTEETIADSLAADEKFWEWASAQVRINRIVEDKGNVRFKLSLCFFDQDASPAVIDPATGLTHQQTEEPQEFYRSTRASDASQPITIIKDLNTAIISQQKEIPVQMEKMLAAVVENGQKVITATAEKSAAIITASIEPLTKAFGLIEKAYLHESTRADKASDCVIRMLNSKDNKSDSPMEELNKLLLAIGTFVNLAEKTKKVVDS